MTFRRLSAVLDSDQQKQPNKIHQIIGIGDVMEPRKVESLGEGERDAMWKYDDPIWPAHYSWHPEEGWVYRTRSMPAWRPSATGHDTVTTATITHGACGERYFFVEVARFRAGGWVLFTPSGPVAMPDEIGTDWEAKHLASQA